MIRQAISCDICGTEKKQTNHWFVAYDQAGELRISGWSSRNRLRPGSRHLCGQTCLHKLVDEFMARSIQLRPANSAQEPAEDQVAAPAAVSKPASPTDTSLTARAAYSELESSARLITPSAPAASVAPARPPLRPPVELVPLSPRIPAGELSPPVDEAPQFSSRSWRAEAWERER
ncbi:MAG: hypothetical protein WCE75_12525, partial [Terracidiphilus sp.]